MSNASRAMIAVISVALALVTGLAIAVVLGPTQWTAALQNWQSGLGTFFGLTGLAVAAFLNGQLARDAEVRQRTTQLDTEKRLRDQSAKVLATELLAELISLRGQLKHRLDTIKLTAGFVKFPQERMELLASLSPIQTPMHDKSVGQLAILGTALALDVECAFSAIGIADRDLAKATFHRRVAEFFEKLTARIEADEALAQKTGGPIAQELLRVVELVRSRMTELKRNEPSDMYIQNADKAYLLAMTFAEYAQRELVQFVDVASDHRLLQLAEIN
jgi:hypothetical protein